MSMQISVDPAGLTKAQREAVAGFILAYPAGKNVGNLSIEVSADTSQLKADLTAIHKHVDAIADLAKDGEAFDASVAFGGHGSAALDADAAHLNAVFGQGAAGPTLGDVGLAPAAAFGGSPSPLPHGAMPAPFTAGAAPSSTVPAATPTLTVPGNVPAPPAPNVAPIPLAPIAAPQTANHAGGVELDKDGFPWDARIHAESKARIADGTWRKKRNLDPTVKATVEAELRQLMGAPAAPLAPVRFDQPAFGDANTSVNAIVPPPPVAGAAPVMQAAPNVAPPADARAMFVGLVGRASAAIQGGKVTQAEVAQCCAAHGVAALPLLANRLDLVSQVAAQVDALIASRP
jgi:hypothetical protein